jgi:phage protein D
MPVVTLSEESTRQSGFYVPQFEIKIEGAGLPRNILRDVTQLTYTDNIKEIDSFEVTVNNWDPTTQDFKYVGSETAERLARKTGDDRRLRLFEPCNKEVEVWMGYLGNLHLMMKGTFTTMEPNFPASGAPTLTVRGLNVLHQLRRKQYSTTWSNKRDSEIAKNIATLVDKDLGGKRFRDKNGNPLPIVINPKALAKEPPLPYVAQKNQYDIEFLLTRALRLGYVVFVREGKPKARNLDERKKHLYFGPSDGTFPGQRDVIFKLKWGISLIDFKPTLTMANQVRSVTVNGWDRAKKKAITGKATLDDKEFNINVDLHEVLEKCDAREEIVVDKPVHSEKEAKAVAQAILKDRHKEMVKASGTCVGLPDLRAGRKVIIEGLGSRFSGTYFITKSIHTINDSGYVTKFDARREQMGLLEGIE